MILNPIHDIKPVSRRKSTVLTIISTIGVLCVIFTLIINSIFGANVKSVRDAMQPTTRKISTVLSGSKHRDPKPSYTVANDFIKMYEEVSSFLLYDLGSTIAKQDPSINDLPNLSDEVYRNIEKMDDMLAVSILLKHLDEETTVEDLYSAVYQVTDLVRGSLGWIWLVQAIARLAILYCITCAMLLLRKTIHYIFIWRKECASQIRYLL